MVRSYRTHAPNYRVTISNLRKEHHLRFKLMKSPRLTDFIRQFKKKWKRSESVTEYPTTLKKLPVNRNFWQYVQTASRDQLWRLLKTKHKKETSFEEQDIWPNFEGSPRRRASWENLLPNSESVHPVYNKNEKQIEARRARDIPLQNHLESKNVFKVWF